MLGAFTTANPLFAVGAADVSVSRLVFSSLFQLAPDGTLKPDVATGYQVDEKGLVYTVDLRTDVRWHDGEPLTSKDVVYTYDSIKSPDVKSPLFSSWRDVNVEADGDHTVKFTLPNALASFCFSMTNGIVPAHLLEVRPMISPTSPGKFPNNETISQLNLTTSSAKISEVR